MRHSPFRASLSLITLLLTRGKSTGGGSALPSGYLAAEFLESTGTQYIISFIPPNDKTGCLAVGSFSVPDIGSGLVCARGNGFNPRWYALYASSSGKALCAWENELSYFDDIVPQKKYSAKLNYKNNRKIEFNGQTVDINSTYTGNGKLCFFCFQSDQFRICPGRLFRVVITQDEQETANYIAAVNPTGKPVFFDVLNNTVLPPSSSANFVVGFTRTQARKLANLPTTGGTLTVSLPTGYEADAGVVSALETARANGWTITVQTYASEDVMTTDLFDIWVRKTQDENGQYVAQDGTRWQVDWCNCMYTPDGSTERDHGYESHPSVEEACSVWGLTPYIDPNLEQEI